MRFIFVGLLILLSTTSAFAQAEGEVESIGFQGVYRSDCWTPMVVRLRPKTGESVTLQIQVIQEDLDRDRPIATKTITLTQNIEGQRANEQRFWMYFRPQPTRGGLMDGTRQGTLKQIQDQLKVLLCTENGKQITTLPITQMVRRVDMLPASQWSSARGTKFILCVSDGMSMPMWFDYQNTLGTVEDVEMVTVQPRELPEDVRGYEGIDGMVWLGATVPDPNKATEEKKMRAIQQYVRQGGRLVMCQGAQAKQMAAFGDMLPVTVTEVEDRFDPEPLRSFAKGTTSTWNPWNQMNGGYRMARAKAKTGVVVDAWVDWTLKNGSVERTPYLVRKGYGLGAVTWVAQDLGDRSITKPSKPGWPFIWDRVFDWKNATQMVSKTGEKDETVQAYTPANASADLSGAIPVWIELEKKASGLIFVAILFFVAYWVVAGPGGYFFLLKRKQSGGNWFLFGAVAMGATALTVLVVQIVHSAPSQLKHVSVVRMAPGQPTIVECRLGLYIPSDGYKKIELKETAVNQVSFITPLPIHPAYTLAEDIGEFSSHLDYNVPIHDATSEEPVAIRVPYRCTMKKLEAHWVGNLSGGIEGSAKLTANGPTEIEGQLVNGTGRDLKNVYFTFNTPRYPSNRDRIYFLPAWKSGEKLDLQKALDWRRMATIGLENKGKIATPGGEKAVQGVMETSHKGVGSELSVREGWVGFWFAGQSVRSVQGNVVVNDANSGFVRSFPMLSFFDRLPPMRNSLNGKEYERDRVELVRNGGRFMDMSPAISAGELVVLGQANGAVPFPMEVEGEKVEGDGVIFYQCVVPLDRSSVEEAATRPAE